jgi:stage V sporulation protein R
MERHKLFVAGKRLDQQRMVWQYYVKSRKAEEYRQMMLDSLYHPPVITVDQTRGIEGSLYLMHTFEGKQLVREYVANTLLGIEYLWGSPVYLETSEAEVVAAAPSTARQEEPREEEITWQRVLYSMNEKVLSKKKL